MIFLFLFCTKKREAIHYQSLKMKKKYKIKKRKEDKRREKKRKKGKKITIQLSIYKKPKTELIYLNILSHIFSFQQKCIIYFTLFFFY
jgi:hypothetical protein